MPPGASLAPVPLSTHSDSSLLVSAFDLQSCHYRECGWRSGMWAAHISGHLGPSADSLAKCWGGGSRFSLPTPHAWRLNADSLNPCR